MNPAASALDRDAIYRFTPGHLKTVVAESFKKTRCPYLFTRNKIVSIVKWIFRTIASIFSSRTKRKINSDADLRKVARKLVDHSQTKDKPITGGTEKATPLEVEKTPPQQLREETLKFIDLAVESEFKKEIEPHLKDFDMALNRTAEILKWIADFAISVGDKAANNPLFQKLKEYKIAKEVQPELNHLLTWLLKDVKKDELEKELEETPKRTEYLNWLFSEPKKSFSEAHQALHEKSMMFLVNKKIERYKAILQEKLCARIPQIIQKGLKTNIHKISDILIERGINLITTMNYSALFDSLTDQISKQADAVIECEKLPEDKDKLKAYSQTDICLPGIRDTITTTPSKEEKESIELQHFEDAIANIIPLLLPSHRVILPNGQTDEIDGMVYLLNKQIEIPDELKEVLDLTKDIYGEMISAETQKTLMNSLKGLWETVHLRIQELVVSEAQKEAAKFLSIKLKNLVENLIEKNNLDRMMITTFLPFIQKKLLVSMAREILSDSKDLMKMMESTAAEKMDAKRKESLKELSQQLYEKSQKECHQFKESFVSIKENEYLEIIESMIEDIAEEKSMAPAKNSFPYGPLVVKLLKDIGGLQVGWRGHIPILNNGFWDQVEQGLDKAMPVALAEWRESPDKMMMVIAKGIRKNYATKEDVEKLLFTAKKEDVSALPVGDVKTEITKTAKLAYDLLLQKKKSSAGNIKKCIGQDASKLATAMTNIYEKTLGNRTMNLNLLLCAQESIVRALREANEDLKKNERSLPPERVDYIPTIVPHSLAAYF